MPSVPHYASDPKEGPLHNLYYFINNLEGVVQYNLERASAAAVSIVEALSEYAHRLRGSARDFAPTAQTQITVEPRCCFTTPNFLSHT
jgi:hypothetical protein